MGIPTSITRLMFPLAIGIVTRIIARYGSEAVAAFGIASKIELFAMIIVMALASVIGPFVGQNWGAREFKRLKKGIRYGERFALYWGISAFAILFFTAGSIASLFNSDPGIVAITSLYLKIVSIGYGLQGVFVIIAATLVVLNRPILASILVIFEMFVLYVPLAFIGSEYFGIKGVFSSLALSYIVAGTTAHLVINNTIKTHLIRPSRS